MLQFERLSVLCMKNANVFFVDDPEADNSKAECRIWRDANAERHALGGRRPVGGVSFWQPGEGKYAVGENVVRIRRRISRKRESCPESLRSGSFPAQHDLEGACGESGSIPFHGHGHGNAVEGRNASDDGDAQTASGFFLTGGTEEAFSQA